MITYNTLKKGDKVRLLKTVDGYAEAGETLTVVKLLTDRCDVTSDRTGEPCVFIGDYGAVMLEVVS